MEQTPLRRRPIPAPIEMDSKSRLLYAVNGAAEILLMTGEENYINSLREGMELVASCIDIDRIYIWQNKLIDGRLQYIQKYEWLGSYDLSTTTVRSRTGFDYANSIPEWKEIFIRGECVNGPLCELSLTEQERLGPFGIKSILVIPVHLHNYFWGFVSFDDCHNERSFTDDEVSILRSSSLMMVSAVERFETAAKMRESDKRTKLMLDVTPLSCSLWDANFQLIDCNEETVKLYGLNNKQEYLDRFYDFSPTYQPDGSLSAKKTREHIATAFREGRSVFEWMHRTAAGEPLPTEVTVVRVRRGDGYIAAGYTRDMREQIKMMNAIEYKDALLHRVNDAATILLQANTNEFKYDLWRCMGMLAEIVGADRMYIWKNHEIDGHQYSTQLYEWSEGAEPQQGNAYTVDIPYNELAPSWQKNLPNGQCINSLVRDLSPSEQEHLSAQGILSVLVVPVFLHDQFWGFVGFDDCHSERIFTEIEESILRSGSLLIVNALLRNEMTHDIQAAIDRAHAASKAKSSFLAHISHEIRTPMNVIAGMTELMLREDIPSVIYEYVMSVKHASANMLSLINDILDFSKIEAGSLDIASADYSLTSLINDIIIIIRMKVSEKPLLFTVNIDCNIPNRLTGDETRIRQILLNVLDNAAKYTNEGFVSLSITGEVKDDMVVLSAEVSDSGIGIKKADMEVMFDDFIRVDGETNKSIQGTGLGLAISKSLCQAMGGNITVSSEYGVGSTFVITVPQKIKSHDEKFAVVSNPESKGVLLYETRCMYADSIIRSFDNLCVSCTPVKTQQDFYDEIHRNHYPFVFVSSKLSENAEQMMGGLKSDSTLVLLTEFGETPVHRNIRTLAVPAHSATIANILDDIDDNAGYNINDREKVHFIAPSADILVVDDLNTNLKVAQGLMLPYQMRIDTCGSGEEAIEYIKKKRYDIIFMDHMMPGLNGIETTGRIRSLEDANGYYKNVPIIALTANAVSGVKEMFLNNGLNDFLAKPIDIVKLHGLLEKWVPNEKKEKFKRKRVGEHALSDIKPDQIQIDGVDVLAGIALVGGSIQNYINTLTTFHLDSMSKLIKIKESVEKNDMRLYSVLVHGLKSSAASIGAWEASNLFKALEIAALRKDTAFIVGNTNRYLDSFETLLSDIHTTLLSIRTEPKIEIEPDSLEAALNELLEAFRNRDAGHIDDIINTLTAVKWDKHTDNIFKEILKNARLFNYDEASAFAEQLLTHVVNPPSN